MRRLDLPEFRVQGHAIEVQGADRVVIIRAVEQVEDLGAKQQLLALVGIHHEFSSSICGCEMDPSAVEVDCSSPA